MDRTDKYRRWVLATMLGGTDVIARVWPETTLESIGARSLASLQLAELADLEEHAFGGSGPCERSPARFWQRRAHLSMRRQRAGLLGDLAPVWRQLLATPEPELRRILGEIGFALLAGLVATGARTDLVLACSELGEHAVRLLVHVRNVAELAVVAPWAPAVAAARATARQRGEPPLRQAYLIGRSALATAFHRLSPTLQDQMLRASRDQMTATSLPDLLANLAPLVGAEQASAQAEWVLSVVARAKADAMEARS
ncbi:MAG: hypothetical protein IPK26_02100 [Planctomycetes bacterium]|nr:hypothetical protein [Planctomycetota bacterium]